MNSEQITVFLQEHWYIASVLIGAVILIGATRNWNWLCDPTGTRDAHRHSRGYRRVVFFLLGVLLIVVSIWGAESIVPILWSQELQNIWVYAFWTEPSVHLIHQLWEMPNPYIQIPLTMPRWKTMRNF